MKQEYKILIYVFLIFVAIKALLSYFIPTLSIFSDEYAYAKIARSFFYYGNFLVHGTYSGDPFLYPIFLSIAYVFKDMLVVYPVMKFINALLSSAIIFPIYFLARDFLTHKKSLLISIVVSVLASNFIMASYIASENLFYPLFAFTILFLYKAFKTNKISYFLLAGLFLGLSFSTRLIGITLVPICFCTYIWKRDIKFSNVFWHYLIAFAVVLPLLLLNVFHFGFSLKGLLGKPLKESVSLLGLEEKIPAFLNYIPIYAGYAFLALGVLFALYFLLGYKIKDKNFKLLFFISLITLIFTVLIAADHSSYSSSLYSSPFSFFTNRPVGRYVDSILPLILVTGFIAFSKYRKEVEKNMFKAAIALSAILLISAQLTIAPLFPFNNQTLTWLGLFQYAIEFFLFKKTTYEPTFFWASFLILAAVLALIPLILYKFRRSKKIILLLFIFFLANSMLAYSITYWNSKVNWQDNEQVQLGLWFNKFDKGKSSILFDEQGCTSHILKNNPETICEPEKSSTVAGFWMNNDLRIGNLSEIKKFDYVVSKQKLDLEIVRKTENEIYLYKVDKLN